MAHIRSKFYGWTSNKIHQLGNLCWKYTMIIWKKMSPRARVWMWANLVILLVLYVIVNDLVSFYSTFRYVDVLLLEREQVQGSVTSGADTNPTYLIYTDVGSFELIDDPRIFRWDSSDEYGQLELNRRYRLLVSGYRVPYLSEYPNIVNYWLLEE